MQSGRIFPVNDDRVVGHGGAAWTSNAAAGLSGHLQQRGRLVAALHGICVQIRGRA